MEQNEFQEKAGVIRILLETEGRVMLCLDATQKGVDVPRRFSNDPGLMLVFNSKMPQPIHILTDSVASELRFGGIPHYCVIPYTALWSAFNPDTNSGKTWVNSIPESVRHTHGALQIPIGIVHLDHAAVTTAAKTNYDGDAATAIGTQDPSGKTIPETKVAPSLRVIEGGGSNTASNVSDAKKSRPALRLVE